MGKRLKDPMNKATQRSVAFKLRQILFFAKYPDFKPDSFCVDKVDEQIAEIDPEYLDEQDPRRIKE